MRDVIDRLAAMGVATDTILLLGGGARSHLWARIRADISGRPVMVPRRVNTSPVGAAVLAAVAAGIVGDLRQATQMAGSETVAVMPEPNNRLACDRAYAAYRRLFDRLETMLDADDAI